MHEVSSVFTEDRYLGMNLGKNGRRVGGLVREQVVVADRQL
jgi:hypothetical protein